MPVDINYQDQRGCTLLHHVISYKPPADFVKRILDRFPEIDFSLCDQTQKSLFHFSTWTGDAELLKALLDKITDPKVLDIGDRGGKTALHLASLMNHEKCLKLLLDAGANVNATARDQGTPLLLAQSSTACEILLAANADPLMMDRFGSTALHLATSQGRLEAAKTIASDGGRSLNLTDNDGYRPLDMIVFATRRKDLDIPPEGWCSLAKTLVENNANVFSKDLGGQTVIHKLVSLPAEASPSLLKYFLSVGESKLAEMEDDDGRSALHLCNAEAESLGLDKLLRAYCSQDFLDNFESISMDLESRSKSNANYLLKRGAHSRIPFEARKSILNGEHNLTGFANCLKRLIAKKADCKILIMVGAGISVNSGIPDFRGKDGVYKKYDSNIFTMDGVVNHSQDFYDLVRACFMPVRSGTFKPTATHYFFKLLHDKGLLQRVYTQNIDGLEEMAGLPEEMLVKAHGDFKSAVCTGCARDIAQSDFWSAVESGGIPRCPKCESVVRPCVTFFGEPLNPEVFSNNGDFAAADALIVMGTTLLVYPFAGFVNEVTDMTPRLLINKEGTGPFKHMPEEGSEDPGARYRDATYLGDCDQGVREFCVAMDWEHELSTSMKA